jgi:hypothetical protein
MLDKVKEEYREGIQNAYDKLILLLDNENSYIMSTFHLDKDNLELSKKGYKEMALNIYNGETNISSLQRKKVYEKKLNSPFSWNGNKVEYMFRDVVFESMKERLEYKYSSVDNIEYGENLRNGSLCVLEISSKKSSNNRGFWFKPYLSYMAINAFDELIEICFKAKNKIKLKGFDYEIERDMEEIVETHLNRNIRNRKINSVLK